MAKRGERAARRAEASQLVGRAFRCGDGIVRWIVGLSTRDYFSLLWLDESDGRRVWHGGGIEKIDRWQGGEEVPAPRPGDRYQLAGPTGLVSERTVPPAEAEGAGGGRQG